MSKVRRLTTDEGRLLGEYFPASRQAARDVLFADEGSDEGRSEFMWVRLENGDLILGVFPQGETYFGVEVAVSDDYLKAEVSSTG